MAAANLCDPLADEQLNLIDQQLQPTRWLEKSVIIHRDENGFGLRVGGQNPVFVDYVHENGAAWRANVRKGDLIIKVNGTLVKSLDHKTVVGKILTSTTFVNLTLHSPVDAPLIGRSLLGSAALRTSSTNLNVYPQQGHINLQSQSTCSPLGPQTAVTPSPSSLINHNLMQQIPSQNQQRYQQGNQDMVNARASSGSTHTQINQPITNTNNLSSSNSSFNHASYSPTMTTVGTINSKPCSSITSPRLFNIENDCQTHNLHHLMNNTNSKPIISRPNPLLVACQTMPSGSFSAHSHQNPVFVKANSEILHHQQQQVSSNQFNTDLLVWHAIENLFSELITRNTEIRHQDIKLTLLQFFHYSLTTQRHSTHPTLFFVIAELYRAKAAEMLSTRCNKRELSLVKRWAFEIFSTFLIPHAPLAFLQFDSKKLDKIADIINNQSPICSSLLVTSSPALIVPSSNHHNSNTSNATTLLHTLSNSSNTEPSSNSTSNTVLKNSTEYMQSIVHIFENVSKQTSEVIKAQIEDFEQHLARDNLRDRVINSTTTAGSTAIVGILCDIVVSKLSSNPNQNYSNTNTTNTLNSVDSGFTQRGSNLSMMSSLVNSSSAASNSGDTISIASSVATSVGRNSTLEVVSLSDAVNLLVAKIEQIMLSVVSTKDEEPARDFISLLAQITSFATILRMAFNQQLLVTGNIDTFLSTNYPSTRRCASSVEPGGLQATSGTSTLASHKSSNTQPHKRHKSLPASSNGLNSTNTNYIVENATGASGSYHLHPLQNLLQSSTGGSLKQTNSSSASLNHQSSINDRFELNGHNFMSCCDTAILFCNGCGLPLFAWFSYACSSCEVYSHRWCLKKASETACIDTTKNNSNSTSRASKMSTRSRYRPRNFKSRLVEDFKSLKITAQPASASLSSSSSSSSLTDCDQDSTWLEYYDTNLETTVSPTTNNTNKSQKLSSDIKILSSKNYQSSEDLLSFCDDNIPIPTSSSTNSLQNLSTNSVGAQSQTSSQTDNLNLSGPNNNNNTDSQSNIFDPNSTNSNSNVSIQQPPQSQPPITKPKSTTKRLEIIKELLETERAHVGRLKHLDDLFYKPLVKESMMTPEQSTAVFSCHKRLYKIHKTIYRTLISARNNNRSTADRPTVVSCAEPLLGKVLVQVFLSDTGKQLEQASCEFCACQATNSEVLNKLTRRDSKAADFLAQAGNQPSIGRLGIKDLLASCFQRLTKYPLLLENLLKATPKEKYGIEHDNIKEALDRSKEILVHVDDAVKMSVSQHRLLEVLRRTDKPAILSSMDINNQNLLHDGPLALRLRNRVVDVHVLLMTDYLVILTKDSQDKFKLRPFSQDGSKPLTLSPIFDVDKDLKTRNIATDGNAFYLLQTGKGDPRMYELGAQSPNDRAKWCEKIQQAVDQKMTFLSVGLVNSMDHNILQQERPGCDTTVPYKYEAPDQTID